VQVDNGDISYAAPYQQYLPSVLNYPLFWVLRSVFQQVLLLFYVLLSGGSVTALAGTIHAHSDELPLHSRSELQS
jgi:hypothetical protein